MASRYYGIGLGDDATEVTDDSSTTGKALELVVDLAVFTNRQSVVDALKNLEIYFLQKVYPPA